MEFSLNHHEVQDFPPSCKSYASFHLKIRKKLSNCSYGRQKKQEKETGRPA
jgi:hypothetical protein